MPEEGVRVLKSEGTKPTAAQSAHPPSPAKVLPSPSHSPASPDSEAWQSPGSALAEPYSSPQDPLDKYAAYIVRGAVVGTGLVGLAALARSVRLFTRFEHARQIPEDFIRKGVRLQGRVSTVEPDGALRVAHKPLARLPSLFRRSAVPGLLTVRLAGLEVLPRKGVRLQGRVSTVEPDGALRVAHKPLARLPSLFRRSAVPGLLTVRLAGLEVLPRKGVRLQGRVSTVEPDGALRVAHKPLARLPSLFRRSAVPGLLTVRLAGLEVLPRKGVRLQGRVSTVEPDGALRVAHKPLARLPSLFRRSAVPGLLTVRLAGLEVLPRKGVRLQGRVSTVEPDGALRVAHKPLARLPSLFRRSAVPGLLTVRLAGLEVLPRKGVRLQGRVSTVEPDGALRVAHKPLARLPSLFRRSAVPGLLTVRLAGLEVLPRKGVRLQGRVSTVEPDGALRVAHKPLARLPSLFRRSAVPGLLTVRLAGLEVLPRKGVRLQGRVSTVEPDGALRVAHKPLARLPSLFRRSAVPGLLTVRLAGLEVLPRKGVRLQGRVSTVEPDGALRVAHKPLARLPSLFRRSAVPGLLTVRLAGLEVLPRKGVRLQGRVSTVEPDGALRVAHKPLARLPSLFRRSAVPGLLTVRLAGLEVLPRKGVRLQGRVSTVEPDGALRVAHKPLARLPSLFRRSAVPGLLTVRLAGLEVLPRKGVRLQGRVSTVEPDGALRVAHKPLARLPSLFRRSAVPGLLTVRLAGLEVLPRKGVRLQGRVSTVEPDGALRVAHKPLARLPSLFRRSAVPGLLTVRLAGLEVLPRKGRVSTVEPDGALRVAHKPLARLPSLFRRSAVPGLLTVRLAGLEVLPRKGVRLQGRVSTVEPDGALRVAHKPLARLPSLFRRSAVPGLLTVRLAGLEVLPRKGVRLQGRVSTVEPDGALRVAHKPLARLPSLFRRSAVPGLLTVRLAGHEVLPRKGVRLQGRVSTVEPDGALRVAHKPLARLPSLFRRSAVPGLLTVRLAGLEVLPRKGVRLQGRVSTVEPDGALRVAHKPLARLPSLFRRSAVPGLLTVRLAGLEVSGSGANFLRQKLGSEFGGNGRTVWFTLIHRPEKGPDAQGLDEIHAEVTAKLGKLPVWNYNLNQELVRRGLGRVPSTGVPGHVELLRSSAAYSRLVNQLLISERIADRRGVGMWQRETYLEGLQALPSQAKDILTNTSAFQLLVLLGLGAKNIVVTTTRVGLWTAKKTPGAIETVASGTKTAIKGGTQAYLVAADGTRKALRVSRSVWQRASDAAAKAHGLYQGLRRRLSPKPK